MPKGEGVAINVDRPRSCSSPITAMLNMTVDMLKNEISPTESVESEQYRRFRRVSNKKTLNQTATLVLVSPLRNL